MVTERRSTLGPWLDRILIGSVGAIIIWFGGELRDLTKTVQTLCVTMASNGVEVKNINQRLDRQQLELDEVKRTQEVHLREDRQKFYLVTRPRSGQTEQEHPPRP